MSYSSALDGRDLADECEEAAADNGSRDESGEGTGRSTGEKRLEAEKGEYTVDGAGDEPELGSRAEYVGDTEADEDEADDSDR